MRIVNDHGAGTRQTKCLGCVCMMTKLMIHNNIERILYNIITSFVIVQYQYIAKV